MDIAGGGNAARKACYILALRAWVSVFACNGLSNIVLFQFTSILATFLVFNMVTKS
ncbi:hypothetical protein BABINDRAFT_160782, partial [Babjeviella inositovora NRRL Y-12698]